MPDERLSEIDCAEAYVYAFWLLILRAVEGQTLGAWWLCDAVMHASAACRAATLDPKDPVVQEIVFRTLLRLRPDVGALLGIPPVGVECGPDGTLIVDGVPIERPS